MSAQARLPNTGSGYPGALTTAASSILSSQARQLLVVVFDLNASAWSNFLGEANVATAFPRILDQFAVFFNIHLSLRRSSELALIVCHRGGARFVYPPPKYGDASRAGHPPGAGESHDEIDGRYEKLATAQKELVAQINELASEIMASQAAGSASVHQADDIEVTKMAAALSSALCYINRFNRENYDPLLPQPRSRILIVTAAAGAASATRAHYIPMMNCLASAQKAGACVDVCVLGAAPSSANQAAQTSEDGDTFLRQLAVMTRGIYWRVTDSSSVLQHLMCHFTADADARQHLPPPSHSQAAVDFRATCFCHRKQLDIGFICAVCLSVYCNDSLDMCSTCSTPFSVAGSLRPAPAS
ncbi:hypothetical protein H696_02387 [Fonticula alba]|uniref:General transcription and DNA repair factor IIH subunit TFB4 n=1 Tax=Fonticula alba TaxID=691883 RepID=A0A058ZAK4_FONAL|nr:hypothetical protein H696_02387 [Fonticula alba]KCV71440.1 hypothetical protein H696_02387 [Fonticula alba]|eukprot:XP_009494563.1 hypothetical protein H696_02387 [Fonticula alba]